MRWSRKSIYYQIKNSIFKIEIFSSEIEVKKISSKLGNRIGYTAGYDWAWCAEHEKLYFNPLKI